MDKNENRHWDRVALPEDRGMRIDRYWARELEPEGVSRAKVKGWIESGLAAVDGGTVRKGKIKLEGGERLTLRAPDGTASDDLPRAEDGPLDIVFEDDHLIVLDKPAGLTVHPAPGEPAGTLVNRLLARYPDLGADTSGMAEQRPGIVHRLDKDTSGVMAVARTEADRLKLAADFADRNTAKHYLAIVHGVPERTEGFIDAPMGRHPSQKTKMAVVEKGGREAKSHYEVLRAMPDSSASLVLIKIFTGRTHQIRVHMAHIGHPLVGDRVYGPSRQAQWDSAGRPKADRQMLHAFHLCLNHPETGERLRFHQHPPHDFTDLLECLHRRPLTVGLTGMPGCGKSRLCAILRDLGHPVFSADECVAELYRPGGDGASMINARFGSTYSNPDGGVDKKSLFNAMLESDSLRREIMDMIHPMVRHACMEFFTENKHAGLVFAEIPLLLESGWHERNFVNIAACIHCDETLRTGAFREARNLSPEMLATFDSWQWPAKDKLAACDLIIENPGNPDGLQAEAESFVNELNVLRMAKIDQDMKMLASLWPELALRLDGADQ
ncbi:dephospho-CoA kinase [Salidesulfovibrio brasiliensis]